MKKTLFTILLTIGAFFVVNQFTINSAHAAVVITTSTTEFSNNQVARELQQASDGSLIRIYINTGHILFATSTNNGTTWSTSASNQIFYNDDFTGFQANSFIDSSNNVYFTFNPGRGANNNVNEVKLTYSAGSWTVGSNNTVVNPNSINASPSIIKDASGTLWDAYASPTATGTISVLVQTSTNDGVSWGTATVAINSTSGQPVAALISLYNNAYPIVIIQDNNAPRASQYVSGAWTTPVTIDSVNGSLVYLSAVSIGSTFMYVGVRQSFGTLSYNTYNGTSWGTITSLPTVTASDTFTNQLTTDGTNAWLVYSHLTTGTTNYDLYQRKWNGSVWDSIGTALTVTGNDNIYPDVPLKISPGGTVGYSWQSNTASPFNINFDSFATASATPSSSGFSFITFLKGALTKLLPGSLLTLR